MPGRPGRPGRAKPFLRLMLRLRLRLMPAPKMRAVAAVAAVVETLRPQMDLETTQGFLTRAVAAVAYPRAIAKRLMDVVAGPP